MPNPILIGVLVLLSIVCIWLIYDGQKQQQSWDATNAAWGAKERGWEKEQLQWAAQQKSKYKINPRLAAAQNKIMNTIITYKRGGCEFTNRAMVLDVLQGFARATCENNVSNDIDATMKNIRSMLSTAEREIYDSGMLDDIGVLDGMDTGTAGDIDIVAMDTGTAGGVDTVGMDTKTIRPTHAHLIDDEIIRVYAQIAQNICVGDTPDEDKLEAIADAIHSNLCASSDDGVNYRKGLSQGIFSRVADGIFSPLIGE